MTLTIAVIGLPGCQSAPMIPSPQTTGLSAKIQSEFVKAAEAIRRNPESSAAWGGLGQLCMAHSFTRDAITCFQTAAKLDPKNPRWPYLQGVLYEESDLEQSSQFYSHALSMNGESAIIPYRLAQVLWRLGRPDEARAEFQRAQQLAPNDPSPRVAIARFAMSQADWTTAEANLQLALKLAPSSPSIHRELAQVAVRRGDWAEAIQHQDSARISAGRETSLEDKWLREVTDLEMVGQSDAERADRLLAEGRLAEAVTALQTVIREHPDLHRAQLNLAVALWQMNRIDEAQRVFRQLVTAFPEESAGYLSWGSLLASIGRFQEAKLRLEQAVERKSDAAEASSILGMIAERLGSDDDAIQWYRKAIQAAPELIANYISLAALLERRGDQTAAEKEWKVAALIQPNNPAVAAALHRLQRSSTESTSPASALTPENSKE